MQTPVETVTHHVAVVPRATIIDVDDVDDALWGSIDIDLTVNEMSERTRLEMTTLTVKGVTVSSFIIL